MTVEYLIVHNTQINLHLLFWLKFVQHKLSEKFSAEMEFCRIDPGASKSSTSAGIGGVSGCEAGSTSKKKSNFEMSRF
jgi:hypothetical protein